MSKQTFPRLVLQALGSVVLLLFLVVLAATYLRPQMQDLGQVFVARFGVFGMALGTFLADALSVPVPPQFYLLTAVTTSCPPGRALAAIAAASVIAGHAAFWLSRRLGSRTALRALLEPSRARADQIFRHRGHWAVLVGALSPIPYSLMCYTAGFYRIPYALFSVFTLLRVPRLVFLYFVIRAGWR